MIFIFHQSMTQKLYHAKAIRQSICDGYTNLTHKFINIQIIKIRNNISDFSDRTVVRLLPWAIKNNQSTVLLSFCQVK